MTWKSLPPEDCTYLSSVPDERNSRGALTGHLVGFSSAQEAEM
jgi:hypothetical protein